MHSNPLIRGNDTIDTLNNNTRVAVVFDKNSDHLSQGDKNDVFVKPYDFFDFLFALFFMPRHY